MEECCQYYIEIESTIGADLNDVYLEIDTCTRPILVSDLPDSIPVDIIDGLDPYISGYLDEYNFPFPNEFDCGTP